MKFLFILSVIFLSTSAFANHTTYGWLTCKSDDLKIKAYTESCIGAIAVAEAGKDSFAIEKNCSESEDKFSFSVEFKDAEGKGYNQFAVTGEDGTQGVLVVGHLGEIKYSDEYMKVYKSNADVYLHGDRFSTDLRKYTDVYCEVELNLWP